MSVPLSAIQRRARWGTALPLVPFVTQTECTGSRCWVVLRMATDQLPYHILFSGWKIGLGGQSMMRRSRWADRSRLSKIIGLGSRRPLNTMVRTWAMCLRTTDNYILAVKISRFSVFLPSHNFPLLFGVARYSSKRNHINAVLVVMEIWNRILRFHIIIPGYHP